MLIMYLNRYVCTVHKQVKKVTKIGKVLFTDTQGKRVRGGEDTGKVILRTLNYLPNDDVKSELSQYMCNVCAEILGEYRELVVLISDKHLGVHLSKK